ncbi:thioredoxin family Trp26-like protein [Hordeum vulgare]|nr:thioredoxin family Trp26-like protein [Hordeum vulgare]
MRKGGVAEALKSVVGKMKAWDTEVVGDVEGRLKKAKAELERCMADPVSQHKIEEETLLRLLVQELEEKKNTMFKQRAHVWWLLDGDRNTHYFHLEALGRKKSNKIKELKREDGTVVAEEHLTNYVSSFFQDLFTATSNEHRIPSLFRGKAKMTEKNRWQPPKEGMLKINLDGAYTEGGFFATWRVVVRDEQGILILARANKTDHATDPFGAEVVALSEAISMAAKVGAIRVHFEMDSTLLQQAMDFMKVDSSQYAAIIKDSKFDLKMWFPKQHVAAYPRSAKFVAHELAKLEIRETVNFIRALLFVAFLYEERLFPRFPQNLQVVALNESVAGSVKSVFKSWDQRLETSGGFLESNEGDPELLVFIPFTSDVKIKSIAVVGGADGTSPSRMRAFINREGIDFSDAQNMQPVQEWELAENLQGVLEYQTRYSRFQGVANLTLHFPDNFGGDTTKIYYIGLRGEATQNKRDVVATIVYEVMPNPSDHNASTPCKRLFTSLLFVDDASILLSNRGFSNISLFSAEQNPRLEVVSHMLSRHVSDMLPRQIHVWPLFSGWREI